MRLFRNGLCVFPLRSAGRCHRDTDRTVVLHNVDSVSADAGEIDAHGDKITVTYAMQTVLCYLKTGDTNAVGSRRRSGICPGRCGGLDIVLIVFSTDLRSKLPHSLLSQCLALGALLGLLGFGQVTVLNRDYLSIGTVGLTQSEGTAKSGLSVNADVFQSISTGFDWTGTIDVVQHFQRVDLLRANQAAIELCPLAVSIVCVHVKTEVADFCRRAPIQRDAAVSFGCSERTQGNWCRRNTAVTKVDAILA